MKANRQYPFRHLLLALFGLLAMASFVLYGWNSFAPDLLGLHEMQFKHALGLLLFIYSIALVCRTAGRHRNFHGRISIEDGIHEPKATHC